MSGSYNTDEVDAEQTEHVDVETRLDRLETTITRQQAVLAELKKEENDDESDSTVTGLTRRSVLTTGGLLGLLSHGMGDTVAAAPSGQIGTSSDPLTELHTRDLYGNVGTLTIKDTVDLDGNKLTNTQSISGGLTGNAELTDLVGSGLTISSGALETTVSAAWTDTDANGLLEPSDGSTSGIEIGAVHADTLTDNGSGDVSLGTALDLAGNNLEDSGTTIWDATNSYLPQTALENESLSVAGNSVSLGSSTGIAHADLDSVGSSDHHTRPTAGDGLADTSNTFDISVSDFAGTFLSDDGSGDLTVDAGTGLENDGSDNLQAALGNALGFDGSNQIEVPSGSIGTDELATTFSDLATLFGTPVTAGGSLDLGDNNLVEPNQLQTGGGGSDTITVQDTNAGSAIATFNEGGEVDINNGALDLNSNAINNAASVDGGGSAINVDDSLNLSNSDGIQDAGTDAIQFDGSQNVTITNGNLDVGGNTLQGVGNLTVAPSSDSANTLAVQNASSQSILEVDTSNGTTVVRQPGGTADTDELQLSHDGTDGLVNAASGGVKLQEAGSTILSTNGSGAINLNSNDINNVASIDGGGSAISVDDSLNLSNSDSIQDNGTDAIQFDGFQNVTIANGNFELLKYSSIRANTSSGSVDQSQDFYFVIDDADGADKIWWRRPAGASIAFQVRNADQGNDLLTVNDGGEVDVNIGPLDLNSNDINNVASIDNGGSAISVDDAVNLSNSDSIQDSGSDAIQFDGSQNVTIANGNLDVGGSTLQGVGNLTVAPTADSTTVLDVQDKDGNSLLSADSSNHKLQVFDGDASDSVDISHGGTNGSISTSTGDLQLSPSGDVDLNGNKLTNTASVNGGVTGNTEITNLVGAGLSINSGSLEASGSSKWTGGSSGSSWLEPSDSGDTKLEGIDTIESNDSSSSLTITQDTNDDGTNSNKNLTLKTVDTGNNNYPGDIVLDADPNNTDSRKISLKAGGTKRATVNSNGLTVKNGTLDLNTNDINNAASIDGGGSAIRVDDQLDLNGNKLTDNSSGLTIEASSGNNVIINTDGGSRALELGVPSSAAGDTAGGNFVAGHPNNSVNNGAAGAVIGGGGSSGAAQENVVEDDYCVVAGGEQNQAGSTGSDETNAKWATVGGGLNNTASGLESTVAGGWFNEATANYATVAGGGDNVASGSDATVPGGYGNTASGTASFAAGEYAKAEDTNAFVWNDGSGATDTNGSSFDQFSSSTSDGTSGVTGTNTFHVKSTAGIRLVTSGDNSKVTYISGGSAGWSNTSTRTAKTNVERVEPERVLTGVESMPVSTWEYTDADGDGNGIRFMGPMAEDFHDPFDIGDTDSAINSINADGVAFAAIQGLAAKLDDCEERIDGLEAELDAKDDRIDRLETRVERKDDRTDSLEAENTDLRERNAELEQRLATVEAELGIDATASQQEVADD